MGGPLRLSSDVTHRRRFRLGSLAIAAAAGGALLAAWPVRAGADGGPRAAPILSPRPPFYPYFHPWCPHQYWDYLAGSPPPASPACGAGAVASAARTAEPGLPRVGLGAFGGAARAEGSEAGTELGLVARLRVLRPLAVEAELSTTGRTGGGASDERIGGALLLHLLPGAALSPYVAGGGGFARAELDGDAVRARGAYGEIGVGLEWTVLPHLALFADARAGVQRREEREDPRGALARSSGGDPAGGGERFARARVGGLLQF
jgi:hypothetical protein